MKHAGGGEDGENGVLGACCNEPQEALDLGCVFVHCGEAGIVVGRGHARVWQAVVDKHAPMVPELAEGLAGRRQRGQAEVVLDLCARPDQLRERLLLRFRPRVATELIREAGVVAGFGVDGVLEAGGRGDLRQRVFHVPAVQLDLHVAAVRPHRHHDHVGDVCAPALFSDRGPLTRRLRGGRLQGRRRCHTAEGRLALPDHPVVTDEGRSERAPGVALLAVQNVLDLGRGETGGVRFQLGKQAQHVGQPEGVVPVQLREEGLLQHGDRPSAHHRPEKGEARQEGHRGRAEYELDGSRLLLALLDQLGDLRERLLHEGLPRQPGHVLRGKVVCDLEARV